MSDPTEVPTVKVPETKLDIAKTLQGLASAVVLLVGGLYAVGLLIVNVHLSRYGLVSLDLARPEYAMAGALWCFLTAAVYGGVDAVAFFVRRYHSEKKYAQMILLEIVLGGLTSIVTVGFVVFIVSQGRVEYDWNSIPIFVALAANGLIVGTLVREAKTLVDRGQVSARALFDSNVNVKNLMPTRLNLIVGALIGISLYAAYVYPVIPREYGGGLRPLVKLFLSTKADKWIGDLGVSAPGADGSVGPVALLMETDGYFIVAQIETPVEKPLWFVLPTIGGVRRGPAVGVDKKTVSAVVYLPRPFKTPQTNAEPSTKAEQPTRAEPSTSKPTPDKK